jgi:hypothetical protein
MEYGEMPHSEVRKKKRKQFGNSCGAVIGGSGVFFVINMTPEAY